MRAVSRRIFACVVAVACLCAAGAGTAAAKTPADALRAGAGQADITPPQTGYYLGGWTRADRLAEGQSTRLYANALVLQRGDRKIALVAAELFAIPAGLQADVAKQLAGLGFDRTSILLAASHTHSGPGGYMNDPTLNTAAPSIETATDPLSFYHLLNPKPADPQLYTFLVHQIAAAVQRADADLQPAEAAWGHATLTGLTQNRSIEAHLADHGIHLPYGKGTPEMDPDGVNHTIDTNVDVLRVDKLVRHGHVTRRVPIGGYGNFADHGTVVKSETLAYSGDHHATVWRDFSDRVRKAAHVPDRQDVVMVYPNSDEGDQTAGIKHTGPAGAVTVGTAEARAMFRAWKAAGAHVSRTPTLDLRWTTSCFCGRQTATGPVDTAGRIGIGFLTGSEEGRGPLYDVTHQPLEGTTSPVSTPQQGDKIYLPTGPNPGAVPFGVFRVGDGVLASIPGEATKEEGERVRAAVLDALRPAGVTHVVVAGLADDYINYVTTPEEYGQQSYEGASTLWGPNEGTFVIERLAELGRDMDEGKPAPNPDPFDPSYGIKPDGPDYPAGADHGTLTAQPEAVVPRMGRATIAWTGGPMGHDRPVDRAFVTLQRHVGKRWRNDDSDLGLAMLWRVDDQGHYTALWEPAASLPTGTFRFHVTATRYELFSTTFRVVPATNLRVVERSGAVARLAYPPAAVDDPLPARADVTVRVRHGVARDRWGNRAG
jgi:neutral ceramidase